MTLACGIHNSQCHISAATAELASSLLMHWAGEGSLLHVPSVAQQQTGMNTMTTPQTGTMTTPLNVSIAGTSYGYTQAFDRVISYSPLHNAICRLISRLSRPVWGCPLFLLKSVPVPKTMSNLKPIGGMRSSTESGVPSEFVELVPVASKELLSHISNALGLVVTFINTSSVFNLYRNALQREIERSEMKSIEMLLSFIDRVQQCISLWAIIIESAPVSLDWLGYADVGSIPVPRSTETRSSSSSVALSLMDILGLGVKRASKPTETAAPTGTWPIVSTKFLIKLCTMTLNDWVTTREGDDLAGVIVNGLMEYRAHMGQEYVSDVYVECYCRMTALADTLRKNCPLFSGDYALHQAWNVLESAMVSICSYDVTYRE